MLDLFRTMPYEGFWDKVVGEVGFPEVINDDNLRWMQAPIELTEYVNDIEPIHLLALSQLNDMLLSKSKFPCLIENACRGSIFDNIVNEDCYKAPWKKAYLEKSCPFGFLWKHFGLDERTVIID